MHRLIGLAVSPGVAWGPAALLLHHGLSLRSGIAGAHVAREIARLDEAREETARQLRDIQAKVARTAGRDLASVFEAQLLMLDDQMLVPRARLLIQTDLVNAEWALDRAFDEVCTVFMDVGDAYLRERRGDVGDVVGRLRCNLRPAAQRSRWVLDLEAPAVLVADELPPSLAGQIDRDLVLGLAIETGSRTHHSAILARSMSLPAVAGLDGATALVRPGATVLVDGFTGVVLIDPTDQDIEAARSRRDRTLVSVGAGAAADAGPVLSADGVPVHFRANVELLEELGAAQQAGAEGIGLFRSEYLIGSRSVESFDEDAQYEVYRQLVERMAPHPVTVRTFDLDEAQVRGSSGEPDGQARAGTRPASRGPLGLRAIRLSLNRRDLFGIQLRALARASRHGALCVLFPLVSAVEELREARAALENARREVRAGGPVPAIPAGVMIEVPSAALTADLLADTADFFSIGTNDLIQYCLAVDRTDGRIADLFEPLHPAILRVVRQVIRVGARRRRGVAVCGEMAGDAGSLLLLLGLGVTEFSMNAATISEAKRLVRQVSLSDLRRCAARALRLGTAAEIRAMLREEFPLLVVRPGGRLGPGGTEEGL